MTLAPRPELKLWPGRPDETPFRVFRFGRAGPGRGGPMRQIEASPDLVARCGLLLRRLRAYLNGKCDGCHKENEKAKWCKIRECCAQKGVSSCAECAEHPDPRGVREVPQTSCRSSSPWGFAPTAPRASTRSAGWAWQGTRESWPMGKLQSIRR